jgi:gliding motility-associated-like protein
MCTGNNSAAVVFNSPLNAGATYNWSTTGGAGLSGYTTSGSGNLPAMPITNSGNTTISLVYAISSTVNLCSGLPTNYTILVHPNARAKFIPTDTIKCPPFAITPAVVGLQPYPLNNGIYQWYVNGTLIGSGTNFPGYSILGEDDSVTVKLKTISPFGCKADSMSRKFYTYKLPHPSFNVVDSVGCGPLTVQMVNTTPNMGFFTYAWNFGNGQTSTLAQPGNIVFVQNPNYTDTVYHVTLTIFSPCDTITVSHDVRVKPKPKALFTPSRTVGCSPMTVTFTNTSLGGNDAYFWDFGDGSTLTSNTLSSVQHTYNTGVLDTFYVKLVAVNSCGSDSITYALYVSPNNIHLLFAINGPQHYGCAPHTVAFVNNTSGAISFNWNFGDGNTTTTSANVDTVYHTYLNPGNYTVTLHASNNCTDTSTTDFITVFAKPTAAFIADTYIACQGNLVNFTNQSTGSSSYAWDFGDGTSSTLVNPTHAYALPGLYTVQLTAISTNVPGNVCTDIKQQQVQVVSTLPGSFTISTINSACAPATITFVNQNRPSVTSIWDFGDGSTGTGDSVIHTYNNVGTYTASLTVIVPGTCTYITSRVVSVNGPTGTLVYTGGFNCYPNAVRLEVIGTGFNTLVWNFGDGNTTTSALQVIYHSYANTGYYLPKVTMQNAAGCNIQIKGTDSIKVDRRYAGYTATPQQHCDYTTLLFQDSTRTFFGTSAVKWTFGDGNNGTGASVLHNYFSAGTYTVQMISIGNSGCADTVTKSIVIQVNHLPVASIVGPSSSCAGKDVSFSAVIQSTDPVNLVQWNISNGVNGNGPLLTYSFPLAGTFTVRLIAGTIYGCLDTSYHTILINPSPIVTASTNTTICLGNSTPLVATGAISYQWSPIQGLSCINCATPLATPTLSTPYVVTGTNSFGCTQTASTAVTVIQPFNMNVSNNDTICIGQSANLLATGATRYSWNPAQGLNNISVSNPVANPILTTSYRVVGYDGFNCFTDTAFVVVAVGKYPIVNLVPDQTLAAGTLFPLNSVIQNGPIRFWIWSPAADLSCATCPLPNAYVRSNTTYMVTVKNNYGCEASDSMQVKVFCQDSQVFVPNAFSPDGDGINDVLMVRGKGIVSVAYFRVFNRWGQLVFERSDFPPNDITYGWDGKIKGVPSNSDVFVFTAAVTCENGTTFVYKSNTSLIK